ncbi:hypothetical protein [uncultured Polaribacter sp.]|uniref:hypothetical protein n=1 Tax=uncultured Polaribacter sp. TaxID=174711 RepID=UPI002616F28C|nr:hypothetical protein [uncultured Polaribacter sp.]
MKKLNYLLIFLVSFNTIAQEIENVAISTKFYGAGKIKKGPKKIYINSFNINYEIYKEAVDFKAGGNGGRIGGNTSSAKATAAVGLGGIDANKMQAKVNALFISYKNRLKKEGYTIIAPEAAGKTEAYSNWVKATGPYIAENYTGIITTAPKDYTFYYRGTKKNGKLKTSVFGDGLVKQKLSKELNDAVIADVNLYVMFSENGTDMFKGRAAKVKIKTNLRLSKDYAISIPKKLKKKKSTVGKLFGSVQIQGATDVYPASSNVTFSNKSGGSFLGNLKNDAEINGILKKQKIVAYQKQGSFVPTSFSSYTNYLDAKADRFSSKTKWIEVDGEKYAEGFYNVCNTFLEKQLDAFFKKIK